MLNFNSILIFSQSPKELADFYAKLFEKEADWSGGQYYSFAAGQCVITIGPHDKVKGKNSNPERIMFNLETENVKEEFEKIKKIGATVIAEPYSTSEESKEEYMIATFADPDGNFFQLMTPWKESMQN